MIRRLKKAIDSCWAKHRAFRVGFVVAFLLSVTAISIYAFSVLVFQPFFGWLVLVLLAVYFAGKYRTALPVGLRRKYWWVPPVLTAIAMAYFSYHNYTLNQIDALVFSITLCLISVGCLMYYSLRKES